MDIPDLFANTTFDANILTDWGTTGSSQHNVEYSDPEILALMAMGSIGFILNIAVISIASRRPAFIQVPVKPLVVSLGSANLFVITFCMIMNATWHALGTLFGSDCRVFKTVEAFSLNAVAYVVVAWTVDRCRSCTVQLPDKGALDQPVEKPRHLTKLVICAWALAFLLSLQHVVVVPSDHDLETNASLIDRRPANMACVSRGIFSPPWKQMVVEFTSISTTFLIPVIFILGCLAALTVNYVRKLNRKNEPLRAKFALRRFHSYDEDTMYEATTIAQFTVVLAMVFISFWGPYYVVLILKSAGLVDLSVDVSTILYLIGVSYALASPVVYLIFHLWNISSCCKTPSLLGRSSSTVRERIEMLQRNQLSRRFDDL